MCHLATISLMELTLVGSPQACSQLLVIGRAKESEDLCPLSQAACGKEIGRDDRDRC